MTVVEDGELAEDLAGGEGAEELVFAGYFDAALWNKTSVRFRSLIPRLIERKGGSR